MSLEPLECFAGDSWTRPPGEERDIRCAVTGERITSVSASPADTAFMIRHAAELGGPALRGMTFHERAKLLKALGLALMERKEELYEISPHTGATRKDGWIDIEGGIATLMVFASKGRREMPDGKVYLDGDVEQLSRGGAFMGRHIAVPLPGVAVHINAFNFPVWGMLEKMAPAILAGMPVIVKPATQTAFLAQACFKMILETGLLPRGSAQFLSGPVGGLLDQLGARDVVSFTGSEQTGNLIRSNPNLQRHGARVILEQDSLNASVLAEDVTEDSPEFEIFISEAANEITSKTGQKCTAIRRIIAPKGICGAVISALSGRLSKISIGNPRLKTTQMGPLASLSQRDDFHKKTEAISGEARRVCGGPDLPDLNDADPEAGAFVSPALFHCPDPDAAPLVHETEIFGPASTVMPYESMADAARLANMGRGSLVVSLVTADPEVAREFAIETAPWHGRIYINNRKSMKEATGHGSPLPHMIHGGPGRAGNGEELGGVRGVLHYMQRTAVQGPPDMLASIGGVWMDGAEEREPPKHPFRLSFDELELGHTIWTEPRTVTLEDIETFAEFTGDKFYAHMDEEAAKANPFFPGRVAHGYLLLSFAAGLFVDPAPGPVLANTGLNSLAFMKPVSPGEVIRARLTAKRKTKRTDEYGEVRWSVALFNGESDKVAEYELLTMVAYKSP